MKIKKGDTVLITAGKDRGKTGKIIKAFPKSEKIIVEGMNMRKKHVKPQKSGEKGQIVTMPLPLHVSNTKIVCPKCGKAARIGYKKTGDLPAQAGKKIRICKKCGQEI
jgi:large subunit ribosomal protein L24